ncbi:MAG: hypothetical protein EPO40_18735 [Myxococcaceae bacterium]|nr:MAG: hypothetical protein EPO40_18735 [Myxococcaceae bacterium]
MRNPNAWQRFRPIRSGLGILCGTAGQEGTLGYTALDAQNQPWILSAAHVLGGANATLPAVGLSVLQPVGPADVIALATAQLRDAALDIAGAALAPGVDFVNEMLGLGPLAAPIGAKVGMRVVKFGAITGMTEGEVLAVGADDLTIGLPVSFPAGCQLAEGGDSGALWVEVKTHAPVGLHYAASGFGPAKAFARPLGLILARFGLHAP